MATLCNKVGHSIFILWFLLLLSIYLSIFMAAQCNRTGHYIFPCGFFLWPPYVIGQAIIFLPCGFFFFLSFYLSFLLAHSQPSRIACLPYFHTWCGLSANLGCRSETSCTRLAANGGRKKSSKIRSLRTIVQFYRAISSQLRHVSTIWNKLVKQRYLPQMSTQYDEVQHTIGWDRFGCLEHPCKFQRVSRLGSVTTRHSSIGCQPNFAALNRERHLYSARRPSCWALAHILHSEP